MIRVGLISTCLVGIASQAVALSCLPPNLARTFNTVNDAPGTYHMAVGTLTSNGPIPKLVAGQGREISATFKGGFLGSFGMGEIQQLSITVDAVCYASWCGGFPNTKSELVVFLQKTDNSYRLQSDPCGGHFKTNPSSKDIKLLQSCLKNDGCTKTQVQASGIMR